MKSAAVVLIGFMGAGKTSVGRVLARRLEWSFVDLDERIEQSEGRTITQIFGESGEASFRLLETAALRRLLQELHRGAPVVVALGGGAPAQPENARLLAEAGVDQVFLDAPVAELWRRCRRDPPPLARDQQKFHRLYDQRRPHYLAAGLLLETGGKSVDEVAAEAASRLGLS